MNGVAATTTVAIGVTQVADLVVWGFSALHLTPPPAGVAGTIAAVILILGHAAWVKWFGAKDAPAPAPVPAPVPAQ